MLVGNLLFGFAAALPFPTTSASDGTYIVVFEKGVETPQAIVHGVQEQLKSLGATINWEYHTVIRGFSVSGTPAIMDQLMLSNNAEYPFVIEKDQMASAL